MTNAKSQVEIIINWKLFSFATTFKVFPLSIKNGSTDIGKRFGVAFFIKNKEGGPKEGYTLLGGWDKETKQDTSQLTSTDISLISGNKNDLLSGLPSSITQ